MKIILLLAVAVLGGVAFVGASRAARHNQLSLAWNAAAYAVRWLRQLGSWLTAISTALSVALEYHRLRERTFPNSAEIQLPRPLSRPLVVVEKVHAK